MTQNIQTQNLATIGENIGLQEGVELVQAFREANPNAVQGYLVGRNILDQILDQPGAVGIRFRKCLYQAKESLVYTGVDNEGNDILQYSVITRNGEIAKKDGIVADRLVWDWEVINKPKRPGTSTENLATIGENIGLDEGVELVQAFREANPNAVQGYFVGRDILDQILGQPGAVGIRFRKCLYLGKESLVYTGVDSEGNDILEYSVVTTNGDIVKENGIVADRLVWDWEVINKPKRPGTGTQN